MSRLHLWLEEWMAIEMMQNETFRDQLYQIQFYNSKALYDLARRKADKCLNSIQDITAHDPALFKMRRLVLHALYYSDNPIKSDTSIDLLELLVNSYQSELLLYSKIYLAELINRSSIHSEFDYNPYIQNLQIIAHSLSKRDSYDVLDLLLKIVNENSLEALYALKSELDSGKLNKPSELHTILSMYAIAYALRFWMKGIHKDNMLISELYEYGLKTSVLMTNDKIPLVRFHNMVSSLAAIKSYEWNDGFIEEWYTKVDSKNAESTKGLARAQNAFYHERYDDILTELRSMEFENIIQKTRALGLELIALYHDDDMRADILPGAIHNFKRYLKRNKTKLSNYYHNSHRNLCMLIEKLDAYRYLKNQSIEPDEFKPLIYRTWAIKQIERSRT